MTKKDFELIASIIRSDIQDGGSITIAWGFADTLEKLTPQFDKQKFLKTCGVL